MKKLQVTTMLILFTVVFNTLNAQFTNFTTSNSSIPSNYVCGGVAVDNNNNVWIGTDAGVAKFNGTTWTVYTTSDGLPSNIISCIAVDNNNNVWIGTDGDGVAKYNGTSWTTYTAGLVDPGIHFIACEPSGTTWFGTWGAGISKFDGTNWTSCTDAQGFPSDGGSIASVYYIYIDNANNKWFGTELGLVKYDNTNFITYDQTSTPNLLSNTITAIAVDNNSNKWLGVSAKGIAKLNSSCVWVANYDTTNGIINNGITDIKIRNGNIWTGEYTIYGSLIIGGITKFDEISGTGVSFHSNAGLVSDQVFRIDIDGNDDIWIATGEGLSKFHYTSGISEYPNFSSLSLYPNPAQDIIQLNHNFNNGYAYVSDVTGRVVIKIDVSQNQEININNLEQGVYYIRLITNTAEYMGKFIKN